MTEYNMNSIHLCLQFRNQSQKYQNYHNHSAGIPFIACSYNHLRVW